MESDSVVLVTGASSGIGQACVDAFLREGARVIAAARRGDRLEHMREGREDRVLPLTMDVRHRAEVTAALDGLPDDWSTIDVLVNNAGLAAGRGPVHTDDPDDWDRMLDTNVRGLLNVSSWVLPRMVERGSGHVINIGSNAGREVYPGGTVYCASKAAVERITRGMRMDVLGSGVRISQVDPGMVQTEFSTVRFHGDEAAAAKVYEGLTPLKAEDIADVVTWVASRPPHVVVADVLVYPLDQAGSGKFAPRRAG
ncbi:SDR family NAD(P)-dependent oxidoreductase [Geodermatophilus sp. YIM 151500]|uniref:SDR family NAD(P)-dependent oxidoreductase n=1 Tax=Geodermatophilus sp. YIM 151500 TaxID=2984531 RepID=UPI0021E39F55|nr:SDR family NAD(P)-dependent oxidoreductase [Geodermatophilus sp. YIM 151500]MCV2488322.1 SDR family NAD(P)-dependent oxidoreductase [Geodermatophilus sp. YIM 151500]